MVAAVFHQLGGEMECVRGAAAISCINRL